jgi:hypothetical protein
MTWDEGRARCQRARTPGEIGLRPLRRCLWLPTASGLLRPLCGEIVHLASIDVEDNLTPSGIGHPPLVAEVAARKASKPDLYRVTGLAS